MPWRGGGVFIFTMTSPQADCGYIIIIGGLLNRVNLSAGLHARTVAGEKKWS